MKIILFVILLLLLQCSVLLAYYTPTSEIKIHTDEYGVVHVVADNEHDVFYGQGRAMAQDRLWQMDINIRIIKGTVSELVGNPGLVNDLFMRTYGLWNLSQAAVPYLDDDYFAVLDAFVSGVNDYIASTPPLTLEFYTLGYRPDNFTVADIILMGKYLSYLLSVNYNSEVERLGFELAGLTRDQIDSLYPPYASDGPTTLDDEDITHIEFTGNLDPLPEPRFILPASDKSTRSANPVRSTIPKISIAQFLATDESGLPSFLQVRRKIPQASNVWTIHGSHTKSGSPLLMNDPHLQITAPSIWYLMSISCPTLNATGASISGVPGITSGRNDRIAWGITNAFADVQDLFIIDAIDDYTYVHAGTTYEYVFRPESVTVKGRGVVDYAVRETLYGPVISDLLDFGNLTVALAWNSLTHVDDQSLMSLIAINKATNFDEFREALRPLIGPAQNVGYADVDGNIGYVMPGKIPVRKPGQYGDYAVSGNGDNDWTGYIPYDQLPYVLNPAKGYIANGNNKITPPSYPYNISNLRDWEEHYRAARIVELIKGSTAHDISSQKIIQLDTVTYAWYDMKPILETIPEINLTAQALTWKSTLLGWNGDLDVDENAPTLYSFWMYELGRLGSFTGYNHTFNSYYIFKTISESNGALLPYAADAFQRVVDTFNGTIPLWGDVQYMVVPHTIFSFPPYTTTVRKAGDSTTINAADVTQNVGEVVQPFDVVTAPSYRHIISLSVFDLDQNSVFILPPGESGNGSNSHFNDMLPLWENGQYIPIRLHNYTVVSTQILNIPTTTTTTATTSPNPISSTATTFSLSVFYTLLIIVVMLLIK